MKLRKFPFILLLLLTLFAGYLTSLAFASDPEAKLFGAEIGGAVLLIAAPFWIVYHRRFPFAAGLCLVGILYAGIVWLNCWAATQAGTRYTRLGDWAFMAIYLMPGLITAAVHRVINRSSNIFGGITWNALNRNGKQ